MRAPALLAGLVLAGCGRCPPLDELTVRGGTEHEAAVLTDELARLQDTLALPVCVSQVRLKRPDRHEGVYNSVTRAVGVTRGLDDQRARETVRHEVCHAVEVQSDVLEGREALFVPLVERGPLDRGKGLEREGFALMCEPGPDVLRPLWDDGCGPDDDAGAQIVRTEVFGWIDDPPAASYEPIAAADLTRLGPPFDQATSVEIVAHVDPDLLRLYPGDRTDCCSAVDVDRWTGDVVGEVPDAQLARLSPGSSDAPEGWFALDDAALPDGTGLVAATLRLPTGDALRLHAQATDGEWHPTEGTCAHPTLSFFSVGDEIWSATLEEGVVSWGRWSAR